MATILRSAAPAAPATWLTDGTRMERTTCALAILIGFSIPLSTSFSEITTGLFMAGWVLSGNFGAKWAVIRQNKVALLSLGLFGLLVAGMTWSVEGPLVSGRCLLKYRELVYLPMFVVIFQEARLRSLATSAYMLAAVILMGLSYFEWLTAIDLGMGSGYQDWVIAKDRIIHSLMMAFLVYLAATRFAAATAEKSANSGSSRRWRYIYAAVIGLAVFNILFMVQGRTGYLLLGSLTTLFLFERLGGRGVVAACVLLGAIAWGGLMFSKVIQRRVEQTISQLENQFGPARKHSPDPRLEFYENTLKLIRRHPWLGTGTGSFQSEYTCLVANTDDRPTSDPHDEYLHLASQVGIAGPLLFVVLLGWQWFAAGQLRAPEMHIGRGVVLTIALGSVFNSLILSVTGGLIYAYFSGLAFAESSPKSEAGALGLPESQDAEPSQPRRRLAA